MPRDHQKVIESDPDDEVGTDEEFLESENEFGEPGEDEAWPRKPPAELAEEGPEAEAELADDAAGLAFSAVLPALPAKERAVSRLCARAPAEFGWLVGVDDKGRVWPLELETVPMPEWEQAYRALGEDAVPTASAPSHGWADAAGFAADWRQRGPGFYLLLHVRLPNLRDGRHWIADQFRQLSRRQRLSAPTLAVAELLGTWPMAYWWLVFGPAIENWPELFEALQREAAEVCAGLTADAVQVRWNAEGREAALALLEEEAEVSSGHLV